MAAALDALYALRDGEGDLTTWRRSLLRPLIEEAISSPDLEEIGMTSKRALSAPSTKSSRVFGPIPRGARIVEPSMYLKNASKVLGYPQSLVQVTI